MIFIREIKKVGFRTWFWFVVYLRRNELSNRLRVSRYYDKKNGMERLSKDRELAHEVDIALSDLRAERKVLRSAIVEDDK